MAITITWVLDPQVIHFGRGELRMTGVRTEVDSLSHGDDREDTYTVNGYADNPGKIASDLRKRHSSKLLTETNQAIRVAEMKATGEAAMNQWEINNG